MPQAGSFTLPARPGRARRLIWRQHSRAHAPRASTAPGGDFRRLSESTRKVPAATTRSPSAKAFHDLDAVARLAIPFRTWRGSNTPLLRSTNTRCSRPESITASRGTVSPAGLAIGNSTSTNISGRRAKPGFSASKRSFKVRVAGSTSGKTLLTRAVEGLPLTRQSDASDVTGTEAVRFAVEYVSHNPDPTQVGNAVELHGAIEMLAGEMFRASNKSVRR